uniref:Phosphatidate cytidylyltransferase, mitochondrial n=1 Tax=Panagrellus redivivus TaxID=6233 RepID=A0A7E4V7R2_PANRE
MADAYRSLLDCLPLSTIKYAFAYGSGAITQANETIADKMVDFIVVTSDPLQFHQDNLVKNAKHYSLVRLLGAERLVKLQTKSAARLYFNTNVSYENRLLKYGIISTEDLKSDLLDWTWMYAAGRLQKPVLEVIAPTETIATQLRENRLNALQAALLQLPDVFTMEQLFLQIVALSYKGDFRMSFGEDKNKIAKIVAGGFPQFERVYLPLIAEDKRLALLGKNKIEQDNSTTTIYHRLHLLPSAVMDGLAIRSLAWDKRQRDVEEILFAFAHRHDVGTHVGAAMAAVVQRSSLSQTAKNALTAGVSKSIIYAGKKVFKMLKSVR